MTEHNAANNQRFEAREWSSRAGREQFYGVAMDGNPPQIVLRCRHRHGLREYAIDCVKRRVDNGVGR